MGSPSRRVAQRVLWEGEAKSLSSAASGGKVVGASYRFTDRRICTDTGEVASSEQIPLWAVRDVDVQQSMTQKAHEVADVVARCQRND